jgi:hypothetical protein
MPESCVFDTNLIKIMAECKFCREDKSLIKAHIIPQAFIKQEVKNSNYKNLRCIYKDKSRYTIIKANGYFDRDILCQSCDNKLGVCEDTLIKFLRTNKESDYNYRNINIAIKGILWKAHITTRPEFNAINLGLKYRDELYNSITYSLNHPEKLPTQDFQIWIQRYKNIYTNNKQDVLANMITCGTKARDEFHGTLYYFDFSKHKVIIRISGKHLPKHINKFITNSTANISDILYCHRDTEKNIFFPNKTVLNAFYTITLN